eukprot:CAMPEP_0203006558 /NCGR_PEP_ID=MMETSP1401-20130829/4813_1 /ASSEMBLY_ACC=CAM_ASM_000894 /TAXON_ID=38833 /ORGANISM="Micromonas pusilla, Strain CCAC1681" /LENGTH=624 /DNA_ID=CAMNT_0049748203 /DNA_START=159 /DNA_END=2030 /DNA_ORIENTATION=+
MSSVDSICVYVADLEAWDSSIHDWYDRVGNKQYASEYLIPKFFWLRGQLCSSKKYYRYKLVPFRPVMSYALNGYDIEKTGQALTSYFEEFIEPFGMWHASPTPGSDHIFLFVSGRSIGVVGSNSTLVRDSFILTPESSPFNGVANPLKTLIIPGPIDLYLELIPPRQENREILFFFRGSITSDRPGEQDFSHHVRQRILDLFTQRHPFGIFQDFVRRSVVGDLDASKFELTLVDLSRSVFCFVPPGSSSWTMRLYLALHAGCVPVVASDDFVPPYQDILDWRAFAVFIAEDDCEYLPYVLHVSLQKLKRGELKRFPESHIDNFMSYQFEPAIAQLATHIESLEENQGQKTSLDFVKEMALEIRKVNTFMPDVTLLLFSAEFDCLQQIAVKRLISIYKFHEAHILTSHCNHIFETEGVLCHEVQSENSLSSWLGQQVMKFESVSKLVKTDFSIIWDGDTILLRPIPIFDELHRVNLYYGDSLSAAYLPNGALKPEYATSCKYILGPELANVSLSRSFVVQFQTWKVSTVRAFLEHVEKVHEKPLFKVLSEYGSRYAQDDKYFSEYTCFAHFALSVYPDTVTATDSAAIPWIRDPFSLEDFGSPGSCPTPELLEGLQRAGIHYVSW